MARLGALGKRSANQVLMEKQVRRFDSRSGKSKVAQADRRWRQIGHGLNRSRYIGKGTALPGIDSGQFRCLEVRPPCLTRIPTVTFFPFHSKRSGLLGPEEPETNSIIVPSAKISPALTMRFVAFDLLFASGLALVFKATSSWRGGCAQKLTPVWPR